MMVLVESLTKQLNFKCQVLNNMQLLVDFENERERGKMVGAAGNN